MVYWNIEKAGDLAQFDDFRLKKQPLEAAYLKLRTELEEAKRGLRGDPDNGALKSRVEDLKQRTRELEEEAPWLKAEVPVEMTLWGTTHGLL
jgi:hypothetical protein